MERWECGYTTRILEVWTWALCCNSAVSGSRICKIIYLQYLNIYIYIYVLIYVPMMMMIVNAVDLLSGDRCNGVIYGSCVLLSCVSS